jgi:Uma2 family endonuclease
MVAEIIFGALVTHPRPAIRHGIAAGALCVELVGPYQKKRGGPGGWIFMREPEVHLGSHVLVPNIASWRRERLPVGVEDSAFMETPSDWVCEVISPSTEKYDKGDKRRIYATYGVPYLWHLDPRARTLETFQLQDGKWLLTNTFADSEDVSAPPFTEITFSLGHMWPLDPPSSDT